MCRKKIIISLFLLSSLYANFSFAYNGGYISSNSTDGYVGYGSNPTYNNENNNYNANSNSGATNTNIVKPITPNNIYNPRQYFGYYTPLYNEDSINIGGFGYNHIYGYPSQTIIINNGFNKKTHYNHKTPPDDKTSDKQNSNKNGWHNGWKKLY